MAAEKRSEVEEMGGLKVSGGSAEQVYGDVISGDKYVTISSDPEGNIYNIEQVINVLPSTLPAPVIGKGMFIWHLAECERGDPEAIASRARESGLTHLVVKITDGARSTVKSSELLELKNALSPDLNVL